MKNLLSKWGILSIELQNAVEYDQGVGVIRDGKLTGVEYVDNTGDEIVIEPAPPAEPATKEEDPFK